MQWVHQRLSVSGMVLVAVLLMLEQPGFLDDAAVDFFQGADFLKRVRLAHDIVEHLFFTFRLENLLPDTCLENADVSRSLEPFAQKRRKLPVNAVYFFSPFFKFLPVAGIAECAFRHYVLVRFGYRRKRLYRLFQPVPGSGPAFFKQAHPLFNLAVFKKSVAEFPSGRLVEPSGLAFFDVKRGDECF